MVRDGLIRLIGQQADLVCCGEAATAEETSAAVNELKPDLVVLDLRLKGADGLELIQILKAAHPEIKILMLSQYDAQIYVERAMRAGARGYLIKDQAADEVLQAIRAVLRGEVYLSREMASLLLGALVGDSKVPNSSVDSLTNRELQVFQLLGAGLSTREIATELKLSFKTIETHRENIKRKLNLRGAAALVHAANKFYNQQAISEIRPRKSQDSSSKRLLTKGTS